MAGKQQENVTPWTDGYYKIEEFASRILLVEGECTTMQNLGSAGLAGDWEANDEERATWKYGEFGEAHAVVLKDTGKMYNNVQATFWGGKWKVNGVL